MAAPLDLLPDTPLMRQYREIKDGCKDAVLFFRLGDFYEMFGEDAQLAAPLLGLALTSRQSVPMCGIPYHNSAPYISRLLKAGHKVAVADQMEEASDSKKLVARSVTRLITPGTVLEDELLEPRSANYLAAVEIDIVGWGAACLDVSTGEFYATQALNDTGLKKLAEWLERMAPAEVLVSPDTAAHPRLKGLVGSAHLTPFEKPHHGHGTPAWTKDPQWQRVPLAVRAALKCLEYAGSAREELRGAAAPVYREPGSSMQLGEAAIRTLDLVSSSTGQREHSLWGFLDRCKTAMGSRKLKDWILHPLTDSPEIETRHNAVEDLMQRPDLREALGKILRDFSDLPRLLNRLAGRTAYPRDLGGVKRSLAQIPKLEALFAGADFCPGLSALTRRMSADFPALLVLSHTLDKALLDELPAKLREGALIREGYNAELDAFKKVSSEANGLLSELERRERDRTKISTLKAGYNSVFGFFIEVTKAHKDKVPGDYIRRQTLVNAERFITPELKELETKILAAQSKMEKLEASLFDELRRQAAALREPLIRFSSALAELDVLSALAETASLNGFVKPVIDLSHDLEIVDGRHPVVSALIAAGQFVPNSLSLGEREGTAGRIVILTGPNMAGKSTYLRQNALIVLMAQMGSFVPAASARIGIVDKILTRVGAQDMLSKGASTFMVEMTETAYILKSATPRSLVILDEVGRGTSTFDGISIAWAVIEALRGRPTAGENASEPSPRVLFATHYFELTEMAQTLDGVANYNVETKEWTNADGKTEIVFLHKISPGPADRSYGIHVGALAGLPPQVIARAQEILSRLESESAALRALKPAASPAPEAELPLFDTHPALQALKLMNTDKMTPLEALSALSALKKSLS